MDLEQRVLYNMIIEAQHMLAFNDLTHLPKVIFNLQKYCFLNDLKVEIKSNDLEAITKLSYLR